MMFFDSIKIDPLFVFMIWGLQRIHVYIYVWCHFLCKQATSFPRGNGLRTLTDVKMAILMIIRYFTRECGRAGAVEPPKNRPAFRVHFVILSINSPQNPAAATMINVYTVHFSHSGCMTSINRNNMKNCIQYLEVPSSSLNVHYMVE